MKHDPPPGEFCAGYVEARLEEAGRALMALPMAGCFPAGARSFWPELPGGETDERGWDIPSARAITRMDQAYRWCGMIPDVEQRRLVLMRSLVWPDSPQSKPRYQYSWRDLRRITGLHSDTLKMRWGRGIDTIVSRLNRPGLCVASGGRIGPGTLRVSRAIETARKSTLEPA